MTILYKNEQSGRSMVEMLGVLAIIGVLSIGGISGYSKAMAKYRINKTLDQISTLVMNIRTLYASAVNYDGLTNGVAVQMGIIPRDMLTGARGSTVASGINIVNVYGGQISLSASDEKNDHRNFLVTYSGLPMEACVSIATADWGSQAGSGLQSIGIGASGAGKIAGTSLTTHEIDTLPLSLSTAAANCSGSGDNGNTIKWTYY